VVAHDNNYRLAAGASARSSKATGYIIKTHLRALKPSALLIRPRAPVYSANKPLARLFSSLDFRSIYLTHHRKKTFRLRGCMPRNAFGIILN
jgi:hypothetical protein